jgi:hypothetical protein
MNALFGQYSKLFLALQQADDAHGQDGADGGHGAGVGSRIGFQLAIGIHEGSYREWSCFSQIGYSVLTAISQYEDAEIRGTASSNQKKSGSLEKFSQQLQ